jgi:hypothetical protein
MEGGPVVRLRVDNGVDEGAKRQSGISSHLGRRLSFETFPDDLENLFFPPFAEGHHSGSLLHEFAGEDLVPEGRRVDPDVQKSAEDGRAGAEGPDAGVRHGRGVALLRHRPQQVHRGQRFFHDPEGNL